LRIADFGERQSEGFKLLCIVARLEFNVLEKNAVAAEAAMRTKTSNSLLHGNELERRRHGL